MLHLTSCKPVVHLTPKALAHLAPQAPFCEKNMLTTPSIWFFLPQQDENGEYKLNLYDKMTHCVWLPKCRSPTPTFLGTVNVFVETTFLVESVMMKMNYYIRPFYCLL